MLRKREQDDQGEVSIIIFGMSKSSGFQNYSICCDFRHFVCVFVFVVVFVIVIVFVFVFVSSYDPIGWTEWKPTTTVTSALTSCRWLWKVWVSERQGKWWSDLCPTKNAPVEPTLIALLDLSVIGFSFVFYDKAIRREQGNLNLLDEPWRQEIPPLFQK